MTFRSLAALLVLVGVASPGFAVEYRLEFEGVWSGSQVVGGTLPGGAHFTTLIGATHDAGAPLWEAGGFASSGIENVAELGQTGTLSSEIQARIAAGTAGEEITVIGMGDFPETTDTTFEIDLDDPHVTLLSMIAPSPDWFVGVSDVPLRVANGWVQSLTLELRPYDAGTEEGAGFSLSNPATSPPEPIAPLAGAPFVGSPVIGRVHFTRLTPVPAAPALALWGLGAGIVGATALALRRR